MKIKFLLANMLLLFAFLFFSPSAYLAATKSIALDIEKSYSKCTFKAVFEEAGDYEITLVSPRGEEYTFSPIDNQTYSCVVKNVKEGTWNVQISEDSLSEIGKVSVSVSAAKKEDGDIKDDIVVGKDIVGLNIYLKNNNVIAEWTDENCGSVSFRITNLDTSELIANEKISEKSFKCTIPESVKNISVEVTPSSSNGINGATATYTLHKSSVDATVSYPDLYYVNSDEITATVDMNESYGIHIEANEEIVMKEDALDSGSYSFTIPLEKEGENLVQLFLVDADGNMSSFDKIFVKDIIAPNLTLAAEYDGKEVEEESTIIEGNVTGFNTFTINDENISVASDGYFSYECLLHQGNNLITLVATDEAGNEAIYNINIFVPEKQTNIPSFILPVLAVIIMIFVFKKDKSKKKETKTPKSTKEDALERDNLDDLRLKDDEPSLEALNQKNANLGEINTENGVSMDELREKKSKTEKKNNILVSVNTLFTEKKSVLIIVYSVLLILFLNFIVGLSHITSGSMEPTLNINDFMVYNRLAYIKNDVSYGDIISFNKDSDIYCKRVVGLGGDELSFHDGFLYRNGEKVEEHYIEKDIETNCTKTFIVPENCIFVLGDNRENSYDSRFWENPYVSISDINGKLLFIIPFGK